VAINLQVAQNVGNFLTSWGTISLTIRNLLHGVNSSTLSKVWRNYIYIGCGQS